MAKIELKRITETKLLISSPDQAN